MPSNQPVKYDADKETNKRMKTKPQMNTTVDAINDWNTFFSQQTEMNIIDEAVISKELQMFESHEKETLIDIDPTQIADALESQNTIFDLDIDKSMLIQIEKESGEFFIHLLIYYFFYKT